MEGKDYAVEAAMKELELAGWLTGAQRIKQGGWVWTVNLAVHAQYAERGARELARREAMRLKITEHTERAKTVL